MILFSLVLFQFTFDVYEVAQRKTFENLKIDLLTKKVFNKLE
jgi:hypothetical protein